MASLTARHKRILREMGWMGDPVEAQDVLMKVISCITNEPVRKATMQYFFPEEGVEIPYMHQFSARGQTAITTLVHVAVEHPEIITKLQYNCKPPTAPIDRKRGKK